MACERSLVVLLVFLCHSWCPRAEAANGEGECISGFGPVVAPPSGYILPSEQVIIPSFQFNGSGIILAFHLSGICAGAASVGDIVSCINILQVWRPSVGQWFSIAADFTATLAVPFAEGVTTSVTVDTPVPFSSGDVLGFSPGPNAGLVFQIATSSQQQASHTYYTYDTFATRRRVKTVGNIPTVRASPIISVEVECCPSATLESPELSSSSNKLSSLVEQTGSPSVSLPLEISSAFGDGSMQEQTSPAPSPRSPTTASQPALESTSSTPEVVTSVATTTSVTSGGQEGSEASSPVPSSPSSLPASPPSSSAAMPIVPTTGGLGRSEASFPVPSSPIPSSQSSLPASPPSSSAAMPIVPTTGGQEGVGASAGVAAGVAVGLVLAVVVVVVVVVVVAIVLAVVCSVRRRKKYDLSGIVTYEVPPDTHIAANCCAEAAPYEMIPLSNGKGSPDGVYDVPCEVDEPKYSDGPFAYDVPCSSTLPLVYDTVSDDTAAENIILQGKPHYNMGCHGNGVLPTDGSEHEYQEADTVPQRTCPLLEESVEQEPFPIYGFVPTVGEQSRLTLDQSTEYKLLQESRADHTTETSAYYNNPSCVPGLEERGDTLASSGSNVVDGVYETSSTDEGTYWSPSSKEEEIYAQMSRRKYQEIPRDKVKMLTKLGEGEFGEVYKAVLKTPTGTSQDVAVKVVKKGAPQEERLKLLQEAAILGQFKHRHVVSLFGVVTLGEPKMMIMDLLPGDLKSHLGQISETDSLRSDPDLSSLLLQFCKQVVDGLVCLAGKSFVHRDIAARNILLDKELNCKISDFGMTREVESEMYYKLGKDTKIPVKWTAPEAILFKKYTTKSDIWSYGMLMYEIWSLGHKPFESNTVQEMVQLLDAHYCLPPPPGCPREVYSVMVDCWNPAHTERPTAADILGNFCKSERVLLAWREEDPVPPLSRTLGAPLSEGETLHRDLQNKYKDSLLKQCPFH